MGIELGTSRTEGRALTNCAILAPQNLLLIAGLFLQDVVRIFDSASENPIWKLATQCQ